MRKQPAFRTETCSEGCLQHLLQLIIHELHLGADDDLASGLVGADDTGSTGSLHSLLIHSGGGIDLQLLGLGPNGHIGFNEPGEAFELETHCVNLPPATIEANKRFFDGNEDLVPKQAYTMGIKTIMQARKVLVVANGLAKAKAVKAVVSGPVTPECPGSILQMHPDCILVADEEALSLL